MSCTAFCLVLAVSALKHECRRARVTEDRERNTSAKGPRHSAVSLEHLLLSLVRHRARLRSSQLPPRTSDIHGRASVSAWDFWEQIGAPRFVCAPMVDQSDLPFRLLCRGLGVDLAYTPMLHSKQFLTVTHYPSLHFDPHPSDRPVVAQFCGHDPAIVLEAARQVQDQVDAIDLNFGCPQAIARKGRYGAFLLDEPDVMVELVRTLSDALAVPVFVKLRMLPMRNDTVALCKRLQEAGASALALHGRTRDQNKQYAGAADWEPIRDVVAALDIPVIANGGIETRADVDACLEFTGAAAVMSSEALLENPALFCSNTDPDSGDYLSQVDLARRYLNICEKYPPSKGETMIKSHLFKILHNGLLQHPELRDQLLACEALDDFHKVVDELGTRSWSSPNFHHPDSESLNLSWYRRHRTQSERLVHRKATMSSEELEARAEERRKRRKQMKLERTEQKRERRSERRRLKRKRQQMQQPPATLSEARSEWRCNGDREVLSKYRHEHTILSNQVPWCAHALSLVSQRKHRNQ